MIILRIVAALALSWFLKTEAYCGRHSPRCFSLKSSDPGCSPSPSYFPPPGFQPSPCVTYVSLPLKPQPVLALPPSCQDSSYSSSSNSLLPPICRQRPLCISSSPIPCHPSLPSCSSLLCPYCKTYQCSCEKSLCNRCGKSPCCCEKSPCSCEQHPCCCEKSSCSCGEQPCCCEKSVCNSCGKSPCCCT